MSYFPDLPADDPLLLRAQHGDRTAWQQLYGIYANPVYALIRRMVGRPAVAEELSQDVFVDVFRNLDGYQRSGSFAGWVRSIAVSRALMYVRSPLHRHARGLATVPGHETLANEAAPLLDPRLVELDAALAALPALTRSIVWLHDVEGYTHAEIARLYGGSVSFSKSQLARAHQQLRARLESQPGAMTCNPAATS